MRNILKLALSVLAVVLSGWLLVGVETEHGISYDAVATMSPALDAIVRSDQTDAALDDSAITQEMMASFADQVAVNGDTVGWLLIPNVCYYPVMYSPVYDYYLLHDRYRTPSAQGSIFINYQCEPNFDGMLTLIHGHNMKNATMFGQLEAYLGVDFFRKNDPIMIFDGKTIRKYKPFTAVILAENNDIIDAQTLSDADRASYIQSMYDRSLCKMADGEQPDLTKPIIFLSTCDYSFNEARFLVGAYLTEAKEVGNEG